MRYQTMRPKRTDVLKKPYKAPVLVVHGTVKDLTRAVGAHGTADGGTRFRIRTKCKVFSRAGRRPYDSVKELVVLGLRAATFC